VNGSPHPLARIGPLRFRLCAAGVGLAPRFVGALLPAPVCEGVVVRVEEHGEIFLLLDHRREYSDRPVYAELWRPLGLAEAPLRGLLLIAPSASGRAPAFRVERLGELADALLALAQTGSPAARR
jgi:hypothetical protein